MPKKLAVNSNSYCDLLKNHMNAATKSVCRRSLTSVVLLQHNNARLHTVCATAEKIIKLHSGHVLHPVYAPTLHLVIFVRLDPSRTLTVATNSV